MKEFTFLFRDLFQWLHISKCLPYKARKRVYLITWFPLFTFSHVVCASLSPQR